MPKFNPSIIVTDIKGKPLAGGEISDGALRGAFAQKRAEIMRRAHKDATQAEAASVPQLEEELRDWVEDNAPKLTLGDAVISALTSVLRKTPDDPNTAEVVNEAAKVKHMRWAMKIVATQEKGPDALVEFDDDEVIKTIRDRVSRAYPDPTVIWRLDEALKAAEKVTALKEAAD